MKADIARDAIKRAAQSLFAARGVDAVSVREILTAAGQRNGASLHYYFGSKDDLVAQLVIDGARLIPLRELPAQLGELPRDRGIIVHCKSGARSARAVKFLLESGFPRVTNVQGGIDAWLAGR